MGTATEAKERASSVVARELGAIVGLSHDVHDHPEISFDERRSAELVADALAGFDVERGVCGLDTAFSARAGSGPLTVAICAEYDALPGVGHACGHNVIAAAAVGAGLALAEVADDVGLSVLVLGTPAEEGGGGKILMLERGAFAGVHAAMMVHPWPEDRLAGTCLAVSHFDVTFTGREAHASAAPWEGVNALDAMTVSQVAVGLLRQQLRPGDQVHGVITNGGAAANIIPASVRARYMCRARTLEDLQRLDPRVRACFDAGALASGASVEHEEICPIYSHMESDPGLLDTFRENAEHLGRRFTSREPSPTLSTDMANVSLAIPSIHPLLGIDAGGAVNHQPAFAAACATPSADQAVHDGAVAMAWTAIDAATRPELRDRLLAQAPGR
ncbi:MAG: M20 family metallopeptidase [Acidimicrobiales bacterium]